MGTGFEQFDELRRIVLEVAPTDTWEVEENTVRVEWPGAAGAMRSFLVDQLGHTPAELERMVWSYLESDENDLWCVAVPASRRARGLAMRWDAGEGEWSLRPEYDLANCTPDYEEEEDEEIEEEPVDGASIRHLDLLEMGVVPVKPIPDGEMSTEISYPQYSTRPERAVDAWDDPYEWSDSQPRVGRHASFGTEPERVPRRMPEVRNDSRPPRMMDPKIGAFPGGFGGERPNYDEARNEAAAVTEGMTESFKEGVFAHIDGEDEAGPNDPSPWCDPMSCC